MPSPVAGWQVDYYIRAVDDSSNVTTDPYEAPFSFYEYAVQQPRAMTIAAARIDANADFIPDLLDTAAILTGIAISPNFSTDRTDFFMQQGDAGINVYFDSALVMVNPGDSITANGIIGNFNGKTQIRIYRSNRLTNLGPGTLPSVTTITCPDLADINGETFEGRLVRINDVEILEIPDAWPQLGWSATMTMVNGADSATLRIDRSTDIDGQPQMAPRATITGVVGQYDTRDPVSWDTTSSCRACTPTSSGSPVLMTNGICRELLSGPELSQPVQPLDQYLLLAQGGISCQSECLQHHGAEGVDDSR